MRSLAGRLHAVLTVAVPSKKPPARKSAAPPENLHIAAIQRIVGKHRNKTTAGRLNPRDLARMRDQLEHATGLSIAEIADLTKHWPA